MKSIETCRVLVIDDEPAVLRVLVMILEKIGFTEIDKAENGEQGISKINRYPYDLILTDILMSDLSGVQVLEHIRKIDNSIPVIGMSGTPWLLTDQFDAALPKPFTKSELTEIIDTMDIPTQNSNSKKNSLEPENTRANPPSSSHNHNRFSKFSAFMENFIGKNTAWYNILLSLLAGVYQQKRYLDCRWPPGEYGYLSGEG
ncbi:MAG: response regulator [Desulfarculaceae bacterium]|nr:response regulator [Desulfarculaceae bacterium]